MLFGVGVPVNEVISIASSLGCAHGALPFSYLDLPVGGNTRLSNGLKENVRGINWVKWNSILLDPKNGGLGVGCLRSKNLSLLGKWKWQFLNEEYSLWRIVIKEFYGIDGGFGSSSCSYSNTGVWLDIIKAIKSIEVHEPWCGDGSVLKVKFPRLYALKVDKDCKVRDRAHMVNETGVGNWSWRIPHRGRALDDLSALSSRLNNTIFFFNDCDRWCWSYDDSGSFKVKVLSKVLGNNVIGGHSLGFHHKWNDWIPRKVNVMVWKASLNRLPSYVSFFVT
ncbi:hypothetical protein Tco_0596617 [Tanacetum coccineum]